jgi:hypothetical protein
MRKVFVFILVAFLAISLYGGLAGAQSGTYTTPPTPTDPTFPFPELPDDDDCIPMDFIDRDELNLVVGGPSATLVANIPASLEPYTVGWTSSDTSVATVVANSPATVSPVGVGSCWVTVNVVSDGVRYCDRVLVNVSAPGGPTPPTAGSNTALLSLFLGLVVLMITLPLLRRSNIIFK